MKALVFDRFGEADVLRYDILPDMALDAMSVLVQTSAVGLNFADIYRRQGVYILEGDAPWIGGYEGAGRVVAVGRDVNRWRVGQRVGFLDVPRAHAERVRAPADRLVALPDDIDDRTAAALLLQGVTAQYLVEDSGRLSAGDRVLVQAASGGVGRLLVQMAHALGAEVHALASTPAKREQARSNGASAVYGYEDWVSQVRQATGGGVDVVYDSIGTTLQDSIAALRPGGRAVIFGKAGGTPPTIDPLLLMEGSKSVVGVTCGPISTAPKAGKAVSIGCSQPCATARSPRRRSRPFRCMKAPKPTDCWRIATLRARSSCFHRIGQAMCSIQYPLGRGDRCPV